jgi:hypothetical protein
MEEQAGMYAFEMVVYVGGFTHTGFYWCMQKGSRGKILQALFEMLYCHCSSVWPKYWLLILLYVSWLLIISEVKAAL